MPAPLFGCGWGYDGRRGVEWDTQGPLLDCVLCGASSSGADSVLSGASGALFSGETSGGEIPWWRCTASSSSMPTIATHAVPATIIPTVAPKGKDDPDGEEGPAVGEWLGGRVAGESVGG
eukprot:Hpha_TRINITY_DN379_c0_g1::TRINITY_DN379_c0_g1_i1::g.112732::m.112732